MWANEGWGETYKLLTGGIGDNFMGGAVIHLTALSGAVRADG